nr:hypothetical protein BaRGS_021075 [Batillaria attramentaria]
MAANPENYFYQLTGHYKGYSVENCVAARAGRQAVKECNCTLSTLESEYNLCTFSDMKNCFISTSSRLLELAEAGDLLGCPRPCHSEEYLTVVSTSYFPLPRANYLQLEFYYEDLRVHKTMHVADSHYYYYYYCCCYYYCYYYCCYYSSHHYYYYYYYYYDYDYDCYHYFYRYHYYYIDYYYDNYCHYYYY